jgi:hypothetical protein
MSRKNPDHRARLGELKAKERADAEAALPGPKSLLRELFHELDQRLSAGGCDHSLRHTMAWADKVGIDGDKLVGWARENGGHCDCEVLGNVPDSNAAFRS